ncbi:MAG: hypothetical protein ACKVZJ_03970 [Phycisphaerales bacterium]
MNARHLRSLIAPAVALTALCGSAFGQTSASVAAGRLTLTTSNADQNVKVEVGPAAGTVRLFGFAGLADGATYSGINAVTVNTGTGRDEVQFDIQAAASFDARANLGTGDALTKTQWKILAGSASKTAGLTLTSAVGAAHLAEVNFDNESQGAAQVNIDTGNATIVSAKVIGDDPSTSLGVNFNCRAPITVLEVVTAAPALNVNLRGSYGNLMNEVKYVLNQLVTGTVNVNTDVTLGSGSDKVEGKISTPGSSNVFRGRTNAGDGDNLVLWEVEGASSVIGQAISSGAGRDFLSIQVKGFYQMSQTLGARISSGAGDDFLVLTTDTAIRGTGLPNDIEPVIDGGAGFDLFNAFGFILNCEGRL